MLLLRNITDKVAYKKQKFVSDNSGGSEVQGQGSRMAEGGPFTWFTASTFPVCPHMAGRVGELTGVCFVRAQISVMIISLS